VVVVLQDARDDAQVVERIAALDIGKAEVVCCARVPSASGAGTRAQEVSTHSAMTGLGCRAFSGQVIRG
jgi:hypothetical protein